LRVNLWGWFKAAKEGIYTFKRPSELLLGRNIVTSSCQQIRSGYSVQNILPSAITIVGLDKSPGLVFRRESGKQRLRADLRWRSTERESHRSI